MCICIQDVYYIRVFICIHIKANEEMTCLGKMAITKCGGSIGCQGFGCSGHEISMQQHAIYIADGLICYMIEKMQAWFWSIKLVQFHIGDGLLGDPNDTN